MARLRERKDSDNFDLRPESFHHEIRMRFLSRHGREPGRIKVVDASKPLDEVYEKVRRVLDEFFES